MQIINIIKEDLIYKGICVAKDNYKFEIIIDVSKQEVINKEDLVKNQLIDNKYITQAYYLMWPYIKRGENPPRMIQ